MEERLRELWDYYAGRADRQDQTVIVELLREVQEICGCVPSNQQREAARVCGVPESLIAALVKRYPSLREADYRHEITACLASNRRDFRRTVCFSYERRIVSSTAVQRPIF